MSGESAHACPALEVMRDDGLADEADRLQSLERRVDILRGPLTRVHASFLLLPENEKTLQKLCIALSSTPSGIFDNSWNALAVGLGFSGLQVQCIRHTSREDFTHLVLKSYATRADATLADVVRVLREIDRPDALAAVEQDMAAIAQMAGKGEQSEKRLIRPDNFDRVKSLLESQLLITVKQLSPTVERLTDKILDLTSERPKDENRTQRASVRSKPQKPRPKYNVFLTFASDGAAVAKEVAKKFRTPEGKRPPIGVLILNEQANKVIQNPERFIMHFFYKMNYVIPILTEGYFNALGSAQIDDADSLDTQFVQFIHDLYSKHYRSSGCLNDKIRCVVPADRRTVLSHMHRTLDPTMKAYVYDKDVEELARRITRTLGDAE